MNFDVGKMKKKNEFSCGFRLSSSSIPENVRSVTFPVEVNWGTGSVLRADIECMKLLLLMSQSWKYYINFTGEEFPLVTPFELFLTLQRLKGTNILDGWLLLAQNSIEDINNRYFLFCLEMVHIQRVLQLFSDEFCRDLLHEVFKMPLHSKTDSFKITCKCR